MSAAPEFPRSQMFYRIERRYRKESIGASAGGARIKLLPMQHATLEICRPAALVRLDNYIS